jgi:hypothetical protein
LVETQGRNRCQDWNANLPSELVWLRQSVAEELEQQGQSSVEDEAEHDRDRDLQRQLP